MTIEPVFYDNASTEPLDIIRVNECEYHTWSLSTKRFRALWNEIERLRAIVYAPQPSSEDIRENIISVLKRHSIDVQQILMNTKNNKKD